MDARVKDRCRGALLGLACGDALGGPMEFAQRGSFEPITGYLNGGAHGLQGGQWTDDTAQALALADSIASVGWDINDQARRYVEWWKTGKYSVNGCCFDIGSTTRAALARFIKIGDARKSAETAEWASSNGCIMRLAPVPIHFRSLYPSNIPELARQAEESSLPTHGSEQCLSACRYLAVVLAALINGEDREKVLSPSWAALAELSNQKPLHPLIQELAEGNYRNKPQEEVPNSGWVVATLEAALWAFHDAKNFEEAVLKAVNLGGDADTIGAVCGQLAGAYWGESGIPVHLRAGLARINMIEGALKGLLQE
jgi:ADP-ribosyl-[dinitrogen reductase] hydrolase